MQTEFSEGQEQFRDVVARFLQDKSPPAEVRRLMATEHGFDRDVWQQMTGEIGLAGTHLPEDCGGFGYGPVELGIVAEEMGRYLYCGPFFASSVMAGYALLLSGVDSAKQSLLTEIASGSVIASLVLDNLNSPELTGTGIRAKNGFLSGTASLVLDAQNADRLVVIATTKETLGLYALSPVTDGVIVSPIEVMDPTRKLASVSFDHVVATKIGELSSGLLNLLWDHICVALAHEMIGGAQHLFDKTIEYTKLRYQFGRPIGSFQGLKHRCADLLMELEFAKAVTHHAAFCLEADADDPDAEPYAASMAKALAADVYVKAAKEAIQMRGGIGFTWEEDTHLWFKRAKSSEVFMGTPSMHRERMMVQLGAEAVA